MCVIGQGRKQPIVLIVLSQFFKTQSKPTTNKLEKILRVVNKKLESHQKLDHLVVLKDEWTVENGFLTPTMKIKSNEIELKFNGYLEQELQDKIIWQT